MQASAASSAAPAEAQTLRGQQRYRRAALTTAAGVLAKGAGLASTLITIPITAPYLGSERFGLFMAFARAEAVRVAKSGLMIFASQVGASFLMSAPVILLGLKFGQDRVGSYAIAQRLLSVFV